MPDPIALCLEDLDGARRGARYTTCVALRGDQPGLGIGSDGRIAWRGDAPRACELWVSADEQLILLRPEGAPPVQVTRAGRSLQAPCGKPVVLIDQDVVETAGRSLRVHVHGRAPAVAAPAPLQQRTSSARLAATIALGISAVSCHKTDPTTRPMEVRENPPTPVPQDLDAGPAPAVHDASLEADAADASEAGALDARPEASRKPPPIEVRPHPPKPVRRD